VASHLNMGMVGEVCIAVSLPGYRSLLDSFLGDESGGFAGCTWRSPDRAPMQLQSLAHAVKGAAASLGLQAIAQAALKIEKNGRDFDAVQCTQAGTEMQELHQTAHALCHRMGLAGSTPPAPPAPAPASVSPPPPALVPA
jgi:hypothetical protein